LSDAKVTPAGVQIPADPAGPVLIDFDTYALRVALVTREHLPALAKDEWGCPGVYALLGQLGTKGKTPVYIGKATALRQRLMHHRNNPPISWWRALAVARDTSHGFNSAEIGYLEGRVAAEVGSRPGLDLHAKKADIDETLPAHLLLSLDAFVPTILAALRLAGADVTPEPEAAEPTPTGSRQATPGTVADLVAKGLLASGAQLVFDQRGKKAEAVVNPSGQIVLDGVAFRSPSGAGKKVLGGKANNGWKAWTVGPDGPSLDDLRKQLNDPGS